MYAKVCTYIVSGLLAVSLGWIICKCYSLRHGGSSPKSNAGRIADDVDSAADSNRQLADAERETADTIREQAEDIGRAADNNQRAQKLVKKAKDILSSAKHTD